jgi:fucose permease
MTASPSPDDWRRAAARRAVVPLVLIAIGAVIASITDHTAQAVGFGIFGVGCVILVSLFFLEVGYSEDRARAREQRRGRS